MAGVLRWTRTGANLESEILTQSNRDAAHAGERVGYASASIHPRAKLCVPSISLGPIVCEGIAAICPRFATGRGQEDFSCKSLQPRRIMPLIFGNRFPWEISQEITWRLGMFLLDQHRCTRIYQGSGEPDALP